jgi:hypothetical protein
MTARVTKKQAIMRQKSIDSQDASAMAEGVKEISSPEKKTSASDKIANVFRSTINSGIQKGAGLPVGNENKEKSSRDLSDSPKSHSNSSDEEGEIVNEENQPSDDDNKSPAEEDENSSSDSSKSSKSSEDEAEKQKKDRRRMRDKSPDNSLESQNSDWLIKSVYHD